MSIQIQKLSDGEEYIKFVRQFITLFDEQLRVFEARERNAENIQDLVRQMPALISLVNTVGYLRGQDGVFLSIRPRTENQSELYEYEDFFEKRLNALIDIIMDSEQKDFYVEKLESYFVKVRTKQKPTVW